MEQGLAPLVFDVVVQPGQVIPYRGESETGPELSSLKVEVSKAGLQACRGRRISPKGLRNVERYAPA